MVEKKAYSAPPTNYTPPCRTNLSQAEEPYISIGPGHDGKDMFISRGLSNWVASELRRELDKRKSLEDSAN